MGLSFSCANEGISEKARELYAEGIKTSMSLREFLDLAVKIITKFAPQKFKNRMQQSDDCISFVAEAMMRESCKTDDKNDIFSAGRFAVRTCAFRLGKRKKRQPILFTNSPERPKRRERISVHDNLLERMVANEEHQKQLALINQVELSNRQRQVVDMRINGLSFREISRSLGIKYMTVYKNYQRAVKKIRKVFADDR